ncbi:MAG: hypothetical protein L3K14_04855 [Thermoplasmata archaeon]|nr:hypothetical protein [Thermoplasmata archaeon]
MKSGGLKREDVEAYISKRESNVSFASLNGLLNEAETVKILGELTEARRKLAADDLIDANEQARLAFAEIGRAGDGKSLGSRLLYRYALHVWVIVVLQTLIFLVILLEGWWRDSFVTGISEDVVAWGGLGGAAFSIYWLRQTIYAFEYSKLYGVFWIVYPFLGAVFGLVIAVAAGSGLVSIGATPGYLVYATIAFLAGMFQAWLIDTLKSVSQAIHPTSN